MISAEAVKLARERLGESQEAFGRRFGVDQGTISRWETKGPPSRGPVPIVLEDLIGSLPAVADEARA